MKKGKEKKDKYLKVLFGPHRSFLVDVGPFYPLWFYSVQIGPIPSNLSTWSYLIDIGPIWSTMVLFGPICSYLVHISPLYPIQFTLVLFRPPCSHSVLFCPFGPLCSIWSICVHFDPFRLFRFILVHFGSFLYTIIQGKDMFKLRVPILILNIIYIYTHTHTNLINMVVTHLF